MSKRAVIGTVFAGLVLSTVLGTASADTPRCTPDPGPQVTMNPTQCFPTPQECATGNYNGVYQVGPVGRGSVCVAAEGHIVVYTGGNANALCGTIIVADNVATGSMDDDPNTCP